MFYLGTKAYSFYYTTQTKQAKNTDRKNSALSWEVKDVQLVTIILRD